MKALYRIAPVVALLACGVESDDVTFTLQAHSFKNSEWSAPVNLGPIVNSSFMDMNATLSPDELSLYFTSSRPGLGSNDIWVSQRTCGDCAWGPPVNIGPPINSAGNDAAPSISTDGHLLFFFSNRDPAGGGGDIYVSRRANPKDDFGWGDPMKLGPEVNTAAFEAGPDYLQSTEDGAVNLYFSRQPIGTTAFDIYMVAIKRDGATRGPAVPVAELNTPFNDAATTVRNDGREVIFGSTRPPGAPGPFLELFVSTRPSVHEPWSTPQHLAELGSPFNDRQPAFSSDARTLIFASTRPGGSGLDDLWMSTRTSSGK